jgi:hypothetical protein
MYIYNVTVKIDLDVKDLWIKWMKEVHIPMVMQTGCFLDYKMLRLMLDEEDGDTYAIQYYVDSIEILEQYQKEHGPDLRNETEKIFKDRYVAIRSVLEVI